jgi:hypothetical protein
MRQTYENTMEGLRSISPARMKGIFRARLEKTHHTLEHKLSYFTREWLSCLNQPEPDPTKMARLAKQLNRTNHQLSVVSRKLGGVI